MLEQAQRAIASLCRAVAGPGGEPVQLLVNDAATEAAARAMLEGATGVSYVRAKYGDCWVRDTLPTFGWTESGALGGLRFRFNGWGGKYEMPFDDTVGAWIIDRSRAEDVVSSWVLEGGAVELNGAGAAITTASCVLNVNRNPGRTRAEFESALRTHASVDRLVWLDRGLSHDHTDGHVDMVARFVDTDTVVCMAPDPDAPNADVLRETRQTLAREGFRILELPAAPEAIAPDGSPLPTTYCNFYVANRAVIVPLYEAPQDEEALEVLAAAFPDRATIGLPTRDLLCGGGSFHCATQPLPVVPTSSR